MPVTPISIKTRLRSEIQAEAVFFFKIPVISLRHSLETVMPKTKSPIETAIGVLVDGLFYHACHQTKSRKPNL